MTVRKVLTHLVPMVSHALGASAEYDAALRQITMPDLDATDLPSLMNAAHEAIHAQRHHEGHPFYADLLASKASWDEEATEEKRVRALTLQLGLEAFPGYSDALYAYDTLLEKDAIQSSSGKE